MSDRCPRRPPGRPYRVLLTSSRSWTEPDDEAVMRDVLSALLRGLFPDRPPADGAPVLVHGNAAGGDRMADRIWRSWLLPVEPYTCTPEQWREWGRAAGIMRNIAMCERGADVCLAFIKDGSSGASHCAEYAESCGIPVRRFFADSSDQLSLLEPEGET